MNHYSHSEKYVTLTEDRTSFFRRSQAGKGRTYEEQKKQTTINRIC